MIFRILKKQQLCKKYIYDFKGFFDIIFNLLLY